MSSRVRDLGCFTVAVTTGLLARHRAAAAQAAASAVIVVGTALPWVHSGDRGISLYELRRVAYRLEADVDLRFIDPVVFVPLALAVALFLRWTGHHVASWVLSLLAAAYTGVGVALMVGSGLPTGEGVPVTGVGAAALGAVVTVEWSGRTYDRYQRRRAPLQTSQPPTTSDPGARR
jgi:hypothetical protein